jgi:hypothetical protein
MAATARALAGSDKEFIKRVDRHLYDGRGPEHFDPGPLAQEIAAWKREYPEIQLATFNYDQLLQRASRTSASEAQAREVAICRRSRPGAPGAGLYATPERLRGAPPAEWVLAALARA